MRVITREQWGATPWRGPTTTRPLSIVSRVVVHYHGGPPRNSIGNGVPREIEAIHLGNGWIGVGYHFVVDQAGNIYEGRGWDKVGAHSPPHNRDGIGVYVAVGGDQKPTDAALAAARDIYDEACRRTGRTLIKSFHGADYPTACPGRHLIAWVNAGMPRPKHAAPKKPWIPARLRKTPRYPGRVVRRGARGWAVKAIQRRIPGVSIDGDFGPATERAVRRWQQDHGLVADGLVGPATWTALMRTKPRKK